jgi:hypothetical protein
MQTQQRRMSHRWWRTLAVAIALVLATNASHAAVAIWCNGTIANLYVDSDGNVHINASFRGDYLRVCNVYGSWNGIGTELCMSWLALATNARVHNRPVRFMYYVDSYTCANLPTYATSLMPVYLMLE